MSAISYVCPHCGANQFLAYGKGLATEATEIFPLYDFPTSRGAPDADGVKSPCIGSKLTVSVC